MPLQIFFKVYVPSFKVGLKNQRAKKYIFSKYFKNVMEIKVLSTATTTWNAFPAFKIMSHVWTPSKIYCFFFYEILMYSSAKSFFFAKTKIPSGNFNHSIIHSWWDESTTRAVFFSHLLALTTIFKFHFKKYQHFLNCTTISFYHKNV